MLTITIPDIDGVELNILSELKINPLLIEKGVHWHTLWRSRYSQASIWPCSAATWSAV